MQSYYSCGSQESLCSTATDDSLPVCGLASWPLGSVLAGVNDVELANVWSAPAPDRFQLNRQKIELARGNSRWQEPKRRPFAQEPTDRSAALLRPRRQLAVYNARYKTQLCVHFEKRQRCFLAEHCHFAHGQEELQLPFQHPKFRTRPCTNFYATGYCDFGNNCFFQHCRPSANT